MGKTRVIAETGAGQHGVATATAAALMDMECEIYMGKEDTDRQALNVYRMELLGAKVHPVTTGTMTLKDAVNETMREWANRMDDTLYVLGSVMGPHPFPTIVRDFQKIIGKEIKEQILEKEGRLPDAVIACVGAVSYTHLQFFEGRVCHWRLSLILEAQAPVPFSGGLHCFRRKSFYSTRCAIA